MDDLLQAAKRLAQKSTDPLSVCVPGRIAYVVSHARTIASDDYALRTHGIAEALNQRDLETLCIVQPERPWDPGCTTRDVTTDTSLQGVRYIHSSWPSAPADEEMRCLEACVERLVEIFRVYRPAAVLAASDWVLGLPAWIAAERLNLPFYNEVRGFREMTGWACEPAFVDAPDCQQWVKRDTFVAQHARRVFTLNQFMRGELKRRGVDESRIDLVPNGVRECPTAKSTDPSLRARLGIGERDLVVGYVGSVSPYEDLDILLAACTQLVEKGEKLKLLLVGDNQTLAASADPGLVQTGLTETRHWLIQGGRVPHEQMSDYYALMDAVVIPRKPLTVCQLVPPIEAAEALAYGKRLVVSDLTPLVEYAQQHEGVVSFEAGSAESLVRALEWSLKRPAPKPNAELLFSAHIEPMVQALKPEMNHTYKLAVPAQKQAIKFHTKPEPTQQIKLRDVSQVDYATARQWFYRQGKITDTLRALENLQARGLKFDKPKRDFQAFMAGMERLKRGWKLPPRQPNPGLMTRRRHVLYCLHQSVPYTTNGYSTRSHGIVVGLQDAGFKVRATTRPGYPWDAGVKGVNKGYHEADVDGVTYAACAGSSLNKAPLDYYLAEAADHYMREAQTSGAEIIVAASNHVTGLPALMAARRLGLPFVYEVRGLWEVTQASIQPEWSGSERYHLMRDLEQQAALEADLVIALTEELANELAGWGVPRERIQVVPNAVNAERFQPMAADVAIAQELNLEPGVPVIGYAGSVVVYEGLELLMEAMATLKQRGQAFNFVLVGDGKVIDQVKAKATALGIEEECRFAGRVAFEEVPRYLSCMDIMPIPRLSSAVTEMVSALKPLEAMAMGKALVLSDVSPHTIIAGPKGERAQLFQKDSAEALSEAFQVLIDSPAERQRLGQAARRWIEQERTWNHVTRYYAEVLEDVRQKTSATATEAASAGAKPLEHITLGLIADQFTTDTLANDIKLVRVSPENWREELARQPIDAMFVESAWKGNDGQWHRKVGYYSDEEFASLRQLLNYCREQGIPSLFWNKEDPVHFDRFRQAATLCDHIFTTDSRRIIPYLTTLGALSQTVSSAPFYASPKIHNLLPPTRQWQPTAAYGGTYYGKRYPERTEYLDKIMSAAAPLGLTVYDRQHDDPESLYRYPGSLAGYVAGGLTYKEMIQAYKAHPVQINVNSVLDSPTMFSRRVVETAACGAPTVSGPGLGMNRYLEGAGHIVRTESEAAQALENLLHHPAYRWRVALKGARAVMRAHTTELRLAQMLRTAGLVISAPEPPAIQLVTEQITEAATQGLVSQTLRPARILASQWQPGTQARLETAGIACGSPEGLSAEADSLWLLADANALADLEPEDLEDLAWPTRYASQARIGFSRSPDLAEGDWPGVALENRPIDAGLQLVRANQSQPLSDLNSWAQQQPSLALRKPPQSYEQAPNMRPNKTVVIAGHDLKFIKPFYPYFTNAGIRLLLDFWTGHNQHNEIASKRLLRQAETVFCEWTLGNAIWYGKHKREGQKLVGRLHAQEMRSPLFDKVPFEAFDTVIFVGPHMLRNAQKHNPALKKNGVVIYNGVDIEAMQPVPYKPTNGKVLGLVGMVPQSKRLDRALDILKELRKEDDGYTLRVKGKRPEEYPWMAQRTEEMAWYEAQYRRLEKDPLLQDAVIFDPHGNNMLEWYAGIDFIVSVSDNESFHLAIAEGAAAGCMPISLPWEGADEIYPKEWVYPDIKAATKGIKAGPGDQVSVRNLASMKFDIKTIGNRIIVML